MEYFNRFIEIINHKALLRKYSRCNELFVNFWVLLFAKYWIVQAHVKNVGLACALPGIRWKNEKQLSLPSPSYKE